MVRSKSRRADQSLLVGLLIAAAIVVVGGGLLTWALWCIPARDIAAGLTNVATVGGIVSGVSLSGTAVFALSGRYAQFVLAQYSRVVRLVLFGGAAAIVLASLACALAVVWVTEIWVRFLLGYTVALAAVVLISTTLLVNSAFKWRDADLQTPERVDPLKGLGR